MTDPQMPTLVLLHAFPLSGRMYEPQRPLADLGWRVLTPHVRGFGETDGDVGPCTMADYARDVLALLDAQGIERAVVGGVSLGGYIAFTIYRLAPERVSGLVLADTRADADTEQARANRARLIALAGASGAAAIADEMVPKLLGATTQARRPDIVDDVRALICANRPSTIQSALGAMMDRRDSTELLASIAVPTLVIVGEEDTLTPPPLSEAIAAGVRGARLVRIPGAGHLPNLEQPDAFNRAVEAFLAQQ